MYPWDAVILIKAPKISEYEPVISGVKMSLHRVRVYLKVADSIQLQTWNTEE